MTDAEKVRKLLACIRRRQKIVNQQTWWFDEERMRAEGYVAICCEVEELWPELKEQGDE